MHALIMGMAFAQDETPIINTHTNQKGESKMKAEVFFVKDENTQSTIVLSVPNGKTRFLHFDNYKALEKALRRIKNQVSEVVYGGRFCNYAENAA